MRVGILSEKGNIRPNNEDCVYASKSKEIFIIADGMGGHKAGEVASKAAINKVRYFIKQKRELYKFPSQINQLIIDAIKYANKSIFNLAKKDPSLKGMGTTIIVSVIYNNDIYIGHVGDSRAYIINNSVNQITSDHSLAQELYDKGSLTKEEAENYPHKNIITRALGINENVQPDTYKVKFNDKDIFLLCTDGLSNSLNESEIFEIIKNNKNTLNCSKTLVNKAIANGSKDNISVIVVNNEK